MEEQKKEEILETAVSEVTEGTEIEKTDTEEAAGDESSSGDAQEAPAGLPTRSLMLMVLAGLYLLYTGYRLCKNVMDGVEGASFGFMLAGIAFFIIGAGMLFIGGRGVFRADKIKKAQEAEEAAKAQAAEPTVTESTETSETAGRKKMSISERAKLAGRIDDEEETEDAGE